MPREVVDEEDLWTEAQTVFGAPSYAVLAKERALAESGATRVTEDSAVVPRVRDESGVVPRLAEARVDSSGVAKVESVSPRSTSHSEDVVASFDLTPPHGSARPEVPSDLDLAALDAELDAFEALATQHDAAPYASTDSLEIPIELEEPTTLALEVSLAPQSESAVWEGLEGELGVFLATYDELPIGTEVKLTVHLTGERSFETRARVIWLRGADGMWPGAGLRLLENRPDVWFRLQRFSRRCRPPMFHC
ncbi:MAG: hypothetical protein KC586_22385 [Myxococcales bacterium]|nr:hypothetical protein [Myxococcales bacterium]